MQTICSVNEGMIDTILKLIAFLVMRNNTDVSNTDVWSVNSLMLVDHLCMYV